MGSEDRLPGRVRGLTPGPAGMNSQKQGGFLKDCRSCGVALEEVVVDLGMAPPCQSFLTADQLDQPEVFYPLKVMVCSNCWLVQLDEYVSPQEIFTEYAYFSSFSTSWLEHARKYADRMIGELGLDSSSRVLEVASNDGYLLRWFVERGIPVLGIEPAGNVADAAEEIGVRTRVAFFDSSLGTEMAADGYRADLIVANNVFAQVPSLHDFVEGLSLVLADDGLLTLEFPHLLRLLNERQFDTIYHEHYSYFSLLATIPILADHGLEVADVEQLPTHGGSLRLFIRHGANGSGGHSSSVDELIAAERRAGLDTMTPYRAFGTSVEELKRGLLRELIRIKDGGDQVVGYGAAGKGNTLLNYCGIGTDFLPYIADRNHHKQGMYTPGTHIPVRDPRELEETRPEVVLILPWNLKTEIISQLSAHRQRGGSFLIPIPEPEIVGAGL